MYTVKGFDSLQQLELKKKKQQKQVALFTRFLCDIL